MPVIQVTMGRSNQAQKRELIEKLSAAAVEVTQIPAAHFTVLITELDSDNIGCAGKTQTELRANRA